MASCIYCGSKDNLNTQLNLTLDDGRKVSVDVCDVHAEDATVRTARQKYTERQHEIDLLMEKAKELGLELAPTSSGLMVATIKKDATTNGNVHRQSVVDVADQDMIDSDVIECRERGVVSVGGTAGAHAVESHRSIDMTDVREQIGDEILRGKVRMEVVEKQAGGVVAIPTKKVNGLGTTHIVYVQTTDQEMQRRFKTIAEQSRSPYGWDMMTHLGKEGVRITNCSMCRGNSVIKNAGKEITCPKCKGKGILD